MEHAAREQLGIRLRGLRRSQQVSLKTLAHRLDVNPSFLSRVERGLVPVPEHLVRRIADAFDAEPEPLMVLAGYLPEDIKAMLCANPEEAVAILRRHLGCTSPVREAGARTDVKRVAMEA